MVSRGEAEANRAKAGEHGLTFPIVLQRGHRREAGVEEISREYGMFATPVAYLIDAEGIIAKQVAVGVEPILSLLSVPEIPTNGRAKAHRSGKEPARRR
jgi:peroxiredoxin